MLIPRADATPEGHPLRLLHDMGKSPVIAPVLPVLSAPAAQSFSIRTRRAAVPAAIILTFFLYLTKGHRSAERLIGGCRSTAVQSTN
mmetsp:Transcript_18980/g.52292  ORF Transcript_18980/g.52292 Transcript_18980/m.52292 type:complete len:87 (+) Transcript_18980:223-483(+)